MPDEVVVEPVEPIVEPTEPIVEPTPRDSLSGGKPQEVEGIVIPDDIRYKVDEVTGEKKEKGWIKKVTGEDGKISQELLIKQLDTLDSYAGAKEIKFDFANSKPEEIVEYFQSNLKPEDHTVYKVDGVAEGTEETIQKMLQDSDIHPLQAEKLLPKYLEYEKSMMEELKSDGGFKDVLKESFGDDFANTAGSVGNMLASVQDDKDKAILDHQTNETLGMIYRTVSKITEQYGIKELAPKGGVADGGFNPMADAEQEVENSHKAILAMKSTGNYTQEQYSNAVARYAKANENLRTKHATHKEK